jgi:hypothetical protein
MRAPRLKGPYALSWAASNYPPSIDGDLTHHQTLEDVRDTVRDILEGRGDGGGRTPCVDPGSFRGLLYADAAEMEDCIDQYPHRLITIGPRGGVRIEPC